MICDKILGNVHDYKGSKKEIEYVDIEWHEVFKKIHKKVSDHGREVGIRMDDSILKRGLLQDDVLYEDEKSILAVNILPCEVIEISFTKGHENKIPKVCYEIGNRHAPLFFGDAKETFVTIYNEPMMQMLLGIHGVKAEKTVKKLDFEKKISASVHNHHH